jgi:oligoendopeptidase F
MLVLGINAATPHLALALVEDGRLVAELGQDVGSDHSETLFVLLETLFAWTGRRRDELSAVGVAHGPGGFTGVRTALACGKTIAQVLGIPDFAGHDIRAAYPGTNSFISFEEGRDIILDTFEDFSPKLGTIARGFFEERYIDALSRSGKRAGAYCLSSGPVFHPFLFLNYNYTLKDVIVMAHEMGHGVHNVVVADHQSLTNSDRVTMFMETPSTFAETLTFQRLLAREVNPDIRQQLLGSQIEAAILKIFKSVAVSRFQLNAYQRRAESVVPAGEYCRMWSDQLDAMFGDAVSRDEWDDWEWVTFHHTLNYPFYDYAYSFGQLLVYALMRQYQLEGASFVPKYLALLEAGTSITVAPLLEMVGVDLADGTFWQQGLNYLEDMVSEFEASLSE